MEIFVCCLRLKRIMDWVGGRELLSPLPLTRVFGGRRRSTSSGSCARRCVFRGRSQLRRLVGLLSSLRRWRRCVRGIAPIASGLRFCLGLFLGVAAWCIRTRLQQSTIGKISSIPLTEFKHIPSSLPQEAHAEA